MSLIPVIKKTWIVIISEGVCKECQDSETGSQKNIKGNSKLKQCIEDILLTVLSHKVPIEQSNSTFLTLEINWKYGK